jgi:fatty acid desaturase
MDTLHLPCHSGFMSVCINETWDPFLEIGHSDTGSLQRREEAAFIEQPRNMTTEVRESVSRSIQDTFPHSVAVFLEAFVTWLSGCPHRGQKQYVRGSKAVYAAEAFGGFFTAIGLGYLVLATGFWYLLPIPWIILAGRAWALFNILHHGIHNTLFKSMRLNRLLASCSSIIAFSSSPDSYYKEHIESHHTRAIGTYNDKEAVFMPLGLPPGMPKRRYYRRLAWLIFTPWTYLLYARYRLWDWQKEEPWERKTMVWTFAAALVTGAWYFNLLEALFLVYVVPLFVVMNASGLLGTFSEHHWGTLLDKPSRTRLLLLQQARFLLDPAPDRALPWQQRAGRWVLWWARLLFYHLPVRVAVLPGDFVHHDHHHRHPRTEDWANSAYERFDHLQYGCKEFADFPHTHAWSIGEAIDRVFTRMSAAPPPPGKNSAPAVRGSRPSTIPATGWDEPAQKQLVTRPALSDLSVN